LSVASINVAKHTDKLNDDKKKGVGTFPVRAGQTFARYTTMATILIAYGVVIYLVASGYFSTFMLLILFAGQRAFYAIAVLSKPRPEGPPSGFEAFWPTWFSGFCFYHNRLFGGLFILGVLLDTLFRKLPFQLPLSINWLGATAIGIGVAIAIFRFVKDKSKPKK
jgi:1,4-dihydroxy-2-naphthoate octaprenyltransferase